MHADTGYPVPFEGAPFGPFALFDEGHVGVAVFMTLSGYLFAKLLNGKSVNYPVFLWSRFLRLAPLLSVVIVLVGLQRYFAGLSLASYVREIASGPLLWTFPNGGWSVTAEFHFYIILPFLLYLLRRNIIYIVLMLLGAIAARALLWDLGKSIHFYAYATILGRFDQFAFGIMVFHFRN